MIDNSQNRDALRAARETVREFESFYGMTSVEMKSCGVNDPRLQRLNAFERMDWNFALDEIEAFTERISLLQGEGHAFRYPVAPRRRLPDMRPAVLERLAA